MKGILAVQLRRSARLLAGVSAAAILLSSGAGWATVRHYAGQVQRIDAFGEEREAPAAGEPITFLVVGSDSREGLSDRQVRRLHTGWDVYGQRTDTMMVAHLSRDGEVTVVSLPRDSLATIPAHTDENGEQQPATEDKLNAAYSYGGAPLLVKTVEQTTGVPIDHYLEVNFAGFVKMVNALGGVEVCVPTEISDAPSGLVLPAGRSTLKGRDALAYVRARYFDPTADIGRMKRQQAFVGSMVHKAASSEVLLDPAKATAFVDAMLSSMRVDQSLDNAQVLELTRRLAEVDPSKVTFRTVPVVGERPMGTIGNVVVWDGPGSSDIFTALRDDTEIPKRPAAPRVEVAPSQISVQLLGTGDSATAAYDDFQTAGYALASTPVPGSYTATTIEYDPGYDVSLKTLQAALPGAKTVEVPGLGATFRVTIGDDYAGVTAVSVKDPTESDQPRTANDDLCG
ncbi:MAG TPA: LCP family protein [Actinomycetota bacterium]|jgi:LCP family protein required for cell wall assembly|nr:LCP family protein [Actinomycetota bacterium]